MDTRLDELPTLTPKQTAFVNALLEGKAAADAYRDAYNCVNMSNAAIWVEASRLRHSPKISLWLRHFQRIGVEAAGITMERHLAELARAREEAIASGQISAAVQAEHYRGRATGLYENRMRVTVEPSDEELLAEVDRLLGRETAEALRAALGDECTVVDKGRVDSG